jgi:hypothetical protein
VQVSRQEYVHIVSLHDHGQLIWREDAIEALNREIDKILAKQVAADVVNDVLDWMLEGYVSAQLYGDPMLLFLFG